DALRFVVLVDRLYDREVPVLASLDGGAAPGVLADLFSDELLRSGYRKKYLRALSRLASLTDDGGALLRTGAADAASWARPAPSAGAASVAACVRGCAGLSARGRAGARRLPPRPGRPPRRGVATPRRRRRAPPRRAAPPRTGRDRDG